jgi:hypothetical protein
MTKQFIIFVFGLFVAAAAAQAQPLLPRPLFVSAERNAQNMPLYHYNDSIICIVNQGQTPEKYSQYPQQHFRLYTRKYTRISLLPAAQLRKGYPIPDEWCSIENYTPSKAEEDTIELRTPDFALRLSKKEQKMLCAPPPRIVAGKGTNDNSISLPQLQENLRRLRQECQQTKEIEAQAENAFLQTLANQPNTNLWRELQTLDNTIASNLAKYQQTKDKKYIQIVTDATGQKMQTLQKIGKPDPNIEKAYQALANAMTNSRQICAETEKLEKDLQRRGVKTD